jgi:hypothetical protein
LDGSISFRPLTKAELEAMYRPSRVLGEQPPNRVIALIGRVMERPALFYPALLSLTLLVVAIGWWVATRGNGGPTGLKPRSELLASAWSANESWRIRPLTGSVGDAFAWFEKSRGPMSGRPWVGGHRSRVIVEDRQRGAATTVLEFYRNDQNMESDKPALSVLVRWKLNRSEWYLDVPLMLKSR